MPSAMAASPRPAIRPLLRRLASDGARLAEAEADLARLEARSLLRRILVAVILGVAAFVALLTALVVLAQTGVAALAPNLGSEVIAGLAVGAGILLLAALCVLGLRMAFRWEPESLVLSWLNPPDDRKRKSQWTN